jgi:hypothetical protein
MKRLPDKSVRWSQGEIDHLKQWYVEDGLSIIEIADRLERTKLAVAGKVTSLKLKRPNELRRYKTKPAWDIGDFKVTDGLWSQ